MKPELSEDTIAIVASNLTVAHFVLVTPTLEEGPKSGAQARATVNKVFGHYHAACRRGAGLDE